MKFNNQDTCQFRERQYQILNDDLTAEEDATETLGQLSGLARKLAKRILLGDSIRQAANYFSVPESTARRALRSAGAKILAKQNGANTQV